MNIKVGKKFGQTTNKKFNEAFTMLAASQPKDVTDPETPVQQLWDLVWQNLVGADTIRIGKCDTYFGNGVVKGSSSDLTFAAAASQASLAFFSNSSTLIFGLYSDLFNAA